MYGTLIIYLIYKKTNLIYLNYNINNMLLLNFKKIYIFLFLV